MHDVVDSPNRDGKVEEIPQQIHDATDRAATVKDQTEDQLTQPGFRDRQTEQNIFAFSRWVERDCDGVVSNPGLLGNELAADVELVRQVRDCLSPSEYLDGDLLPLLGTQLLGRPSADRSIVPGEFTLPSRDEASSVGIHACFLCVLAFS
jgi:hypothetical protein